MNNDDLIKQIRQVVSEEIKAEVEPIKKQLDSQGKQLDSQGKQLDSQGKQLDSQGKHLDNVMQFIAHINTAIKTLATKQDVEIAVDVAKTELKADILMLESKVIKKIQSHNRRITNIEEETGIENPDKN